MRPHNTLKVLVFIALGVLPPLSVKANDNAAAKAGIQTQLNKALVNAVKPHVKLSNQEILFERRCEMIEKYLGYDDTAISRAMKYSCDGPQIGVALLIGADMGQFPPEKIRKVYIDRFQQQGLKAEVFIQEELEQGSNMVFFINGESHFEYRQRPVQGLDKVPSVTANAKMMYIMAGQIHPSKLQPLSELEKKALKNKSGG